MKKTWTSSEICEKFWSKRFDYTLEDAFVKVANVKTIRHFRQDAQSDPLVDICSAP